MSAHPQSAPAPAARPALPRTDRAEAILSPALAAAEAGHGLALVTLVGMTGRSSRPLGAQMVVLDDGRHCGYVAGGCVEPAIAAEAREAIRTGHSRMLKLGEGSPFFDIVLPCGGGLDLAIQVLEDTAPLAFVEAALARRERCGLAIDMARHVLVPAAASEATGWSGNVFMRHYRPRTRLVVCGRGLETDALVRLAAGSDLDLVCVTPDEAAADHAEPLGATVHRVDRPEDLDRDLFDPDTAVALLFHDLDWEVGLLSRVMDTEAFYVGALGSRTTHRRRCARLSEVGLTDAQIARIKAPIGAFGPARDATTLAASILADVMGTGHDLPS